MTDKKYNLTKYSCYMVNISMAVVANFSPLLFLIFRKMYGFSFTMLGALVMINFCTQLTMDVLMSLYSHKLSVRKIACFTPALAAAGFFVYAVFPYFFRDEVYLCLVSGTVIFALSGGLAEALISPIIASIPSDNPEREMSKLHSVYAWGVVFMVVFSTVFLSVFGKENWQLLAMIWMMVPAAACIMFTRSEFPPMQAQKKDSNAMSLLKKRGFIFCVVCMFLGGASECTMAQWSSGYLEEVFYIPKVRGDILGVALYSVMLGIGRSVYAKKGKNIYKTLLLGSAGATVCYIVAAVSSNAFAGLSACALTGLCTAMLWPGSIIMVMENFPQSGVVAYALMAAGGDFGGAVGPQIVGAITDFASRNSHICTMAANIGITAEQLAFKTGMLSAAVFPLAATVLYLIKFIKKSR